MRCRPPRHIILERIAAASCSPAQCSPPLPRSEPLRRSWTRASPAATAGARALAKLEEGAATWPGHARQDHRRLRQACRARRVFLGVAAGQHVNGRLAFEPVKDFIVAGPVPSAPLNKLAMLTDYISPEQRAVACPNQDVVYGAGLIGLDVSPVVIQVPDFGDRFWVYQIVDARTDSFAALGRMYGTTPGFYIEDVYSWQSFISFAESYGQAANYLAEGPRLPHAAPIGALACHCVELSLKAVLLSRSAPPEVIKNYGHNLKRLFAASQLDWSRYRNRRP